MINFPATVDMSKSIQSLDLNWYDNLFVGSFDSDYKVNNEDTNVLITESLNEPVQYGNNSFRAIKQEVEVEVFYGVSFEKNIDEIEINLMKKLEEQNWRIANSKSHFEDPDTDQVIKVFYFVRILQI